MEKCSTDERTGLKYELVGDYYLIAEDDELEENQSIGDMGSAAFPVSQGAPAGALCQPADQRQVELLSCRH